MRTLYVLALTFMIALPARVRSQIVIVPPNGNPVTGGTFMVGSVPTTITHSDGTVYQDGFPIFKAPPGTEIVSLMQKTDDEERFFIILNDGDIYEFFLDFIPVGPFPLVATDPEFIGGILTVGGNTFRKIAGDAIYAMDANAIYVSRDTARTWEIDTLGLNLVPFDVSPVDFAIDALQNVYATTKNGLYKQHTDSTRWYFVDSVYYSDNAEKKHHSMGSVYVNRNGIIFASPVNDPFNPFAPFGIFRSSDNGTNWTFVQFNSMDFPYAGDVSGFGDDALGNLYAIEAPGSRLFRSSDLGENWVRIDTPITNRVKPVSSASTFFNSISGDSLLYAGTAMGLFISSDQGATWQEANEGLEDENPLGLAVTSMGRFVYSGTLGLFTREEDDTVWQKVYPVNGFQKFAQISVDNQGNLYTLAEAAVAFGPRRPIKSTDGGNTWLYDTLGLSGTQGNVWYVDETGTQHLARIGFGPGNPPLLYAKPSGGSWMLDTAGFNAGGVQQPSFFFSDKNGNLYVGGNVSPNLWRRPVSGGMWIPDTTGLGNEFIAMGAAGTDGTPYVATGFSFISPGRLFRRTANSWEQVSAPPARAGDWITAISTNSTGALFVAFQRFLTGLGGGVYSTMNNGTTWNFHGADSIIVNQIVSAGGKAYALTAGRGAYDVSEAEEPTFVESVSNGSPAGFALHQNYPNPFNPTTTISFTIPALSPNPSSNGRGEGMRVTLKVYDVLGREVATLVNEGRKPGVHSVRFNASNLSTGIYFYTLKAGNFTATKKLLLVK